MNYKVVVSPIATKNIADAVEYYIEKATKKISSEFLKDYRKTYKALHKNPFYQFHDNNYRFLPFEKFPYVAFFLLMNQVKQYF